MRHFQPCLQVRSDMLVLYDLPLNRAAQVRHDIVREKRYKGQMSDCSRRRIERAVDILLQRSPERIIYNPVIDKFHPFTVNFTTLTVASARNITAREGYDKLLRPFLRKMKKWGWGDYIWKAELQDRGQLHYHVTANVFMRYDKICTEWNKLQRKAGLLEQFAKKHRHYNPNSTDIHAVYRIKNMKSYLTKYLSKAEKGKKKTVGKVWDCSVSLKQNFYTSTICYDDDILLINAKGDKRNEVIRLEHCTIIKCKDPLKLLTSENRKKYEVWQKVNF